MIFAKRPLFFLFLLSGMLFVAACDKDDPKPENEEELNTTLTLTLTPVGGGIPVVFSFKDSDGDGGLPPLITNGSLNANKTYSGTLTILNELSGANLTAEIQREDEDHQFFFQVSGGLNLTVNYKDMDSNGKPVGLTTEFVTGASSSGNLTITLRHKPDKSATNVDKGDILNAGGETDIEVTFNVAF